MTRTRGGRRVSTTPVLLLCFPVLLLSAGCGAEPVFTLGSIIVDDEDPSQPEGGAETTSGDPADPAPDEEAGAEDLVGPGDTTTTDNTTNGNDMPANDYCDAVSEWDAAWAVLEEEVLERVNQERAAGADCGSAGAFEPAGPLTMDAALRCAARSHSADMAVRGYFDHNTPEGLGPDARLSQAEYDWSAWGENIAWGYPTAEAAVAGWMSSPGHCANIMGAQFTETGVGYGEGDHWTQTFGHP